MAMFIYGLLCGIALVNIWSFHQAVKNFKPPQPSAAPPTIKYVTKSIDITISCDTSGSADELSQLTDRDLRRGYDYIVTAFGSELARRAKLADPTLPD